MILRKVTTEDLDDLRRWDADLELAALYGSTPSELARQEGRYLRAIETGGRLAGLISLCAVCGTGRSGELRVVIGRPGDRGQGVGRAAVAAFLEGVFAATRVDRVYLRTLRNNQRAVRCYEHCGFRKVGTLRVRHDARYAAPPLSDDILLMVYDRP